MALYQEIGNHGEIPAILHNQGYVALGTDDYTAARELFAECLRRQQAAGNMAGIVEGINGLAALAAPRPNWSGPPGCTAQPGRSPPSTLRPSGPPSAMKLIGTEQSLAKGCLKR